jgi:beta-mannosidase
MLTEGWELAPSPPGACAGPQDADRLTWRPAQVPGTAAGALGEAADGRDLDADDWWFRCRFAAEPAVEGETVMLRLGGLATLAEVYLNGSLVLESESMFAAHAVDVTGRLGEHNELAVCCRALGPRLAVRRKPRARWRTRLVSEGNLRFHRTMLLGRAPGFAPGPAVVGPWRPVTLERRALPWAEDVRLRARMSGEEGILECAARVVAPSGQALPDVVSLRVGDVETELPVDAAGGALRGSVTVQAAERWWPHTHGRPARYDVALVHDGVPLHEARVGFRELRSEGDVEADGISLSVNDRAVFARGAVWTPLDLRARHADAGQLRAVLESVVAAGMNMLRVPGIAAYESAAFYDLCDELGILVWQDFMFANLDYPESDVSFMDAVAAEARDVLAEVGWRPCLAVLCGSSEVAQQVAMLGLDPQLAHGPLYGELLPRMIREAEVAVPYLPSTPWGGDLPFRTDRGVANYYGVGAYRRPLEDARRARVRFAAECLAFANVPDEAVGWKVGVPRDAGAGWDFEDVRDHYFRLLFGLDPVQVRSVDPERYLELSRAVSGEVMAEVMGEWRRAGSTCRGALILWLKDLAPGAGWGVLDHHGRPKVAYHHLRRALAPVAVWMTDEGLGGVDVHVANDRGAALHARLRVALYLEDRLADEAVAPVSLGAGEVLTRNVEALLGRFVDASWAYRFGPPASDVIVASLETDDGTETLLSQAFRFPAGRPVRARAAAELGVSATLEADGAQGLVRVGAERLLYGVRLDVPGWVAADDAFCLEPGHQRHIAITSRSRAAADAPGSPALSALNLHGRVKITPAGSLSVDDASPER